MAFIKDCGIMIEPQEGMEAGEVTRMALLAEKKGFGYFFRSDHLLPTSRHKGLDSPECWVSLGAVAAATKTIKFGTMVSPIGFRNPALLARMACTTDSLSSGRLQFGVGAGWYEDEYLAHGLEFPSVRVRREQFNEALKIIRPLTQSGRVDFDGKYYSAHLRHLPKRNKGIHMIIGGRGRLVARETVEYADEWNFFGSTPETFEETKRDLEASGRKIAVSQMAPFIIADSPKGVRDQVRFEMHRQGLSKDDSVFSRELSSRGWLIASTKEFPGKVGELRERGIGRFYYQVWQTQDPEPIDLLSEALKSV